MGDWATSGAGVWKGSFDLHAISGTTANTKGAWEKPSWTPSMGGCRGMWLTLNWAGNHSDLRTIVADIGIGSSGSQIVLIENFMFAPAVGFNRSRQQGEAAYFPMVVPNELLWMRAQSSREYNADVYIYAFPIFGGPPGFGSKCDTYGVNASTSLGTAVVAGAAESVFGAWTEITSSCNRVRALIVHIDSGALSFTENSQWVQFDIGIGPANGEVAIQNCYTSNCSGDQIMHPQYHGPFAVDIPSGSRISIRMKTQGSVQKTRYFALYGIR